MAFHIVLITCLMAGFCLAQNAEAPEPWYTPVEGFKPPAPGEHPRLLFRKDDIPVLRRRAETSEGRKMVALLRLYLGNDGERLPDVYNENPTVNIGAKGPEQLPIGAFTMGHPAGYGYLYVLTGDKKYADLSRQAVEKIFEGVPDRDERYAWVKPGTGFRLGMVMMNLALAYDFCYDAWPEDFRQKFVKTIQENQNACLQHKRPLTLETLAKANGYPPGSNHFGAYIGGTGMMVLALENDPGVDQARIATVRETIEKNLVVKLTRGFGDGGWFAEGNHPGRVSSNTGIVPLIQSLRVAAGRDYTRPRPNADAVTTLWAYIIIPKDGRANIPHIGDYGNEILYGRGTMLSHSSEFTQGFGSIRPERRAVLKWVYNHFVEPGEQTNYNTAGYPNHAVFALINWPIDEQEKNPAEVLPRAHRDSIHGYYVFRNRWQDENDILVTLLTNTGPRGYKGTKGGEIRVWGLGMRTKFPINMPGVRANHWEAAEWGGQFAGPVRGGNCALAVTFDPRTKADAAIIMAGPEIANAKMPSTKGPTGASATCTAVVIGKTAFYVQTLQTGEPPKVEQDGEGVRIGELKATFDGTKIVFE